MNSKYYLLFDAVLHHIIHSKDIEFFDTSSPDLPFLVGLILEMMDDSGNYNVPDHHPYLLSRRLKSFFRRESKFKSLADVLLAKKGLINSAKEKLGFKTDKPFSVSHLARCLEETLLQPINKEDLNILWQLKGVALIERFLKIQNWKSKTSIGVISQ